MKRLRLLTLFHYSPFKPRRCEIQITLHSQFIPHFQFFCSRLTETSKKNNSCKLQKRKMFHVHTARSNWGAFKYSDSRFAYAVLMKFPKIVQWCSYRIFIWFTGRSAVSSQIFNLPTRRTGRYWCVAVE